MADMEIKAAAEKWGVSQHMVQEDYFINQQNIQMFISQIAKLQSDFVEQIKLQTISCYLCYYARLI